VSQVAWELFRASDELVRTAVPRGLQQAWLRAAKERRRHDRAEGLGTGATKSVSGSEAPATAYGFS